MNIFLKEFKERGFFYQCTGEENLSQLLDKEKINAYIGFDCTAESLHVGSLLQIMCLRLLQKHGHRPIVLLGGGTTRIGDPSGKDATRRILNEETIKKNINKAINDEEIVFLPMPYLRGRNLGDSMETVAVLVDEGQSCDPHTMYALLTRLGEGSKMFITMDIKQADHKGKSGGERLFEIVDKIEGLEYIELLQNYRSKFVQLINKYWWD